MNPLRSPHPRRRLSRLTGVVTALLLLAVGATACGTEESPAATGSGDKTVQVKDHWDRTVTVPVDPKRVVVLEWEGLVTKSMKIFGVDSALVGVDTATKKMGHRAKIIPSINEAVELGSPWSGVNYEQLAALKPDVVFMEAFVASAENRAMHQEVIDRIESLNLPLIVFISPSNFDQPKVDTAWEYISITGKVFGKEAEAAKLVEQMKAGLEKVTSRTKAIPEDQRTAVAYFATINNVMGTKSIQSHLLTEVVRAKNVAGDGTFVTISEEKLLALNPDALLLAGHEGYLDPSVVYQGKHAGLNWANLSGMRAIKEKRVAALGYDEWRLTIETPIAVLKIAKLAYPDRFADIDIVKEEIAFYRDVYGLSEAEAKEAIQAQKYLGELEVK